MTISAFRTGILTLVSLLLYGCGNPSQRLDEYLFFESPHIRLKVVRYYRNIPFNYLGEQAVVMCQSENTAHIGADDPQDAGWRVLGAVPAGDAGTSAQQAAAAIRHGYEVRGKDILIGKLTVFNISFDACGHFINWDPARLPGAMIDRLEQAGSCKPPGSTDCRYRDFAGSRSPHYEQISVVDSSDVAFTVKSAAFRGTESLRVQSRNSGAVWHVQAVSDTIENHRLEPETIRALPVVTLDTDLDDTKLADWLESILPPHSMVIWPDTPAECGDRAAAVNTTPAASCAGIRFNDSDGNSGALYLAIRPGRGPTFHSAVYTSGDRQLRPGSLTALRQTVQRPGN